MADIVSGTGDVLVGPNWYPAEFVGEDFRWVTNDATAYVPAIEPIEHRVTVDLETGFSFDRSRPFPLEIFDEDDRMLARFEVSGRQTVQFYLPAGRPKLHTLRLHVQNEDKPAAAHDPRVLNFRVFQIRAEPLRPDVVSMLAGFRLGRGGWYLLEECGGQTFRWVNNDAEIDVLEPGADALDLDVEPGPGVGSKPFTLQAYDQAGAELASIPIDSRCRVTLPLPPAQEFPYTIRLHTQSGGATLPGQPRVLNFRVFHIPPC